jgi:hypothetical protein
VLGTFATCSYLPEEPQSGPNSRCSLSGKIADYSRFVHPARIGRMRINLRNQDFNRLSIGLRDSHGCSVRDALLFSKDATGNEGA